MKILGVEFWPLCLVTLVPVFINAKSIEISNLRAIFWPLASNVLALAIAQVFLSFHYLSRLQAGARQDRSEQAGAMLLREEKVSPRYLTFVLALIVLAWSIGLIHYGTRFSVLSLLLILMCILQPLLIDRFVLWDSAFDSGKLFLMLMIGEASLELNVPGPVVLSLAFIFLGWSLLENFVDNQRRFRTPEKLTDYHQEDFAVLLFAGMGALFAALVTGLLNVNSFEVQMLFKVPRYLYICYVAYFIWNMRLWVFANRGIFPESVLLFCLKDPLTYLTFVITVASGYFAL